jgi:hypothetical protein
MKADSTIPGFSSVVAFAKHVGLSVDTVRCQLQRGHCPWPQMSMGSKTKHELYGTWKGMVRRCNDVKNKNYPIYGGRGITVCVGWRFSFDQFVEDMGPRPNGFTLDRIDVNGNYEKSNCRWASPKQQANNTRNIIVKPVRPDLPRYCHYDTSRNLYKVLYKGKYLFGSRDVEKARQYALNLKGTGDL